jgi:hypothetical protein
VICEIGNVSTSTLWLPPLQIADVHFSLYTDDAQVLPFEFAGMPLYSSDELNFIELRPAQAYVFKRILDKDAYKVPADAGQYRLCMHYENNKNSMRNINLWVAKVQSCVLLEIKKR